MKKDVKILIMGLGEIGYSNAEYMTRRGFNVNGYDINKKAVKRAIVNKVIKREVTSFEGYDYYLVCVSTHNPENLLEPSLDGIFSISERLSEEGTEDALVTIESTVAKGTCNKVNRIINHRLHVAHFPHRYYAKEKAEHGVKQIRVLCGCEDCCSIRAISFYWELLEIPVHLVTSIEIAELSKIIENSYRFMEIAFSEELSMFCDAYGIDYNELRDAINSKWNINILEAMDGIGGHCLPKDTEMYLQALNNVVDSSIIKSAKEVDDRYKLKLAYKIESPKPAFQRIPNITKNKIIRQLIT